MEGECAARGGSADGEPEHHPARRHGYGRNVGERDSEIDILAREGHLPVGEVAMRPLQHMALAAVAGERDVARTPDGMRASDGGDEALRIGVNVQGPLLVE